jgi:putative oxidoreductase
VAAGVSKLVAVRLVVREFDHFGYPAWFRLVVGAVEVLGGILLFVPRMAWLGVVLLASVMLGALGTHLRYREISFALVPITLLALLALFAFRRKWQH